MIGPIIGLSLIYFALAAMMTGFFKDIVYQEKGPTVRKNILMGLFWPLMLIYLVIRYPLKWLVWSILFDEYNEDDEEEKLPKLTEKQIKLVHDMYEKQKQKPPKNDNYKPLIEEVN